MGFEKVKAKNRSGSNTELISIRKSGSIGFNQKLITEYIKENLFIELYYDETNNRIGFRAVEEETEDAYKMSLSNTTGSITPNSFLNRNNLVPNITTHYNPTTQKLNGAVELLVIDLGDPFDTYGSPKE